MKPNRSIRALLTVFILPAVVTVVTLAACDSGKKAEEAEADAADGGAEPAAVDDDETQPDPEPPLDTGPMPETAETGEAADAETGGGAEAGEGDDDGGDDDDDDDADDDGDGDDGKSAKKDPEPKKNDGGGSNKKAEQRAAGKKLFEKKCKTCHGLDGKGTEKYREKVPDLPSLAKTKLSESKVVSVVTNGVPDTKMKAYKSKLSGEEIEAVAVYVKSL